MTTTATDPTQPDQQQGDHATLAALTLVLMSGLPFVPMAGYVAVILAPLGISTSEAETVVALVQPRLHPPILQSRGAAEQFTNRTSFAHTAAYLLNASKRLSQGGSVDQERLYLSQHLAARSSRQSAAQQVDQAAAVHGPVVGWHARMDASTTPACGAANGHNFYAAGPPSLGWPGSLHGGTCRCQAGAPFQGAGWVDDAVRSLPAGSV